MLASTRIKCMKRTRCAACCLGSHDSHEAITRNKSGCCRVFVSSSHVSSSCTCAWYSKELPYWVHTLPHTSDLFRNLPTPSNFSTFCASSKRMSFCTCYPEDSEWHELSCHTMLNRILVKHNNRCHLPTLSRRETWSHWPRYAASHPYCENCQSGTRHTTNMTKFLRSNRNSNWNCK